VPKERDALLHNISGRHVTLQLVNEHRFLGEPLVVLEESLQFEQKMGWQIGDIVAVGIERARHRKRQADSRGGAVQRRPTRRMGCALHGVVRQSTWPHSHGGALCWRGPHVGPPPRPQERRPRTWFTMSGRARSGAPVLAALQCDAHLLSTLVR
jgi:hypothetical protein